MRQLITFLGIIFTILLIKNANAQFTGLGSGTKNDPYQITTPAQLDEMRNFRSSHYRLMNDLDLSGIENWIPIGNGTNKFTGSFDGNGKIISNLTINRNVAHQGLLGYYQPATVGDSIKNLHLENVNIVGENYTGGILSYINGGTIYNCSVNGSIHGNINVGGICGGTLNSSIIYCNTAAEINGYGHLGGVVGYLKTSTLIKSYSFSNINAQKDAGGIAGVIEGSTALISECFTRGRILSNWYRTGGIVGNSIGGTIKNCYTSCNIAGTSHGGILGYSEVASTNVQYCYSTGIIEESYSGGIAGHIYDGTIKNNIALNPIIRTDRIEAHGVRITSVAGVMRNNYAWDNMVVMGKLVTNGLHNNNQGQNVTFSQIKDTAFYKNPVNWHTQPWDFDSIWTMDTLNISPYPILRAFPANIQKVMHQQFITWNHGLSGAVGDTIVLSAIGGKFPIQFSLQQNNIANLSNDTIVLTSVGTVPIYAYLQGNDFFYADSMWREIVVFEGGDGSKNNPYLIATDYQLDARRNNLSVHYKLINDIDLCNYENWEPVGNHYNNPFSGSFDGNGHTLSNLKISRLSLSYAGLLGYAAPATRGDSIKNLTVINSDIIANYAAGIIVGYADSLNIYNCHTSGKIIVTSSTVGGIAGEMDFGFIKNCTSSSEVRASEDYAGGITGSIYYGNAENCSFSGTAQAEGDVGGICGYISYSTISNCYNHGKIISDEDEAGGISGYAYESLVTLCYNSGTISTYENSGGIVGEISNTQLIKNF